MTIAHLLLCAALFVVSSPGHALTYQADHFSVTDLLASPQELIGNTLIWRDGTATLVSNIGQGNPSTAERFDATGLTFDAATGYRIVGFTATYDLHFIGGSYLVEGGEVNADYGAPLEPGDTWFATARFDTSTGPSTLFTAADGGVIDLMVTHTVTGPQFQADMGLFVRGMMEFCRSGVDLEFCGSNGGSFFVTTLNMRSLSITPQVIAVPEPATHVLLLAGLAALCLTARRFKQVQATHNPGGKS